MASSLAKHRYFTFVATSSQMDDAEGIAAAGNFLEAELKNLGFTVTRSKSAGLVVGDNIVGKLKGLFISIEMNAGFAGRFAGINGEALPAGEAAEALADALGRCVADVAR